MDIFLVILQFVSKVYRVLFPNICGHTRQLPFSSMYISVKPVQDKNNGQECFLYLVVFEVCACECSAIKIENKSLVSMLL